METNRDLVTRISKPVSLMDVGPLSAQSNYPIIFENIIEHPGFRVCDILVKNRLRRLAHWAFRLRVI